MFSHVHLGSNDPERARKFYDATMAVLGAAPGTRDESRHRYFYFHNGAMLIVGEPLNGEDATTSNGLTIGFSVDSAEQGDAWVAAGLANGGSADCDPPGVRDRGERGQIYLAYMRDPDGNKLCALKFLDSE